MEEFLVEEKIAPVKLSKQFAEALVKFKAELEPAIKESDNPYFKSKYADLETIIETVKKPLAKHGLSYLQVIHEGPDVRIETLLVHESGEMFSCGILSVPVAKKDAQGFGSAMTYARRYSLQTALGVPATDDDGNAASRAAPTPQRVAPPQDGKEYCYRIPSPNKKQVAWLELQGCRLDPQTKIWKSAKPLGDELAEFLVPNRPPVSPKTAEKLNKLQEKAKEAGVTLELEAHD